MRELVLFRSHPSAHGSDQENSERATFLGPQTRRDRSVRGEAEDGKSSLRPLRLAVKSNDLTPQKVGGAARKRAKIAGLESVRACAR
jgi:hypothetical protein